MVEVEYVGEFVGEQGLEPIPIVAEGKALRRWTRADYDAAGRPVPGRPGRRVGMVREHDVDRTFGRLEERRGKRAVDALRVRFGTSGQVFQPFRKRDAEVRRVDRAPVLVRRCLRRCGHRQGKAGKDRDGGVPAEPVEDAKPPADLHGLGPDGRRLDGCGDLTEHTMTTSPFFHDAARY